MTLQELFNIVWERAKTKLQARMYDSNGIPGFCQYRMNKDPNGLACFIGAAIPNDKYVPAMDTADWGLGAILERIGYSGDYVAARHLQMIHDSTDISLWERELRSFAAEHQLAIPEGA